MDEAPRAPEDEAPRAPEGDAPTGSDGPEAPGATATTAPIPETATTAPTRPAATSWMPRGSSLYDDATPRALRRLAWIVGILGAVTGLGAMQEIRALSGHIDPDLASTDATATLETGLLIVRVAAIGAILVAVFLGRRWLDGVQSELVEGQTAGVVDPEPPGRAVLVAAAGALPSPLGWRDAPVGSDRRRALLVLGTVGVALAIEVGATVVSLVAWELDGARIAARAVVVAGVAWLVAAGLVADLIARIERREATVLAQTRANLITVPPGRRRFPVGVILAVAAYLTLLPAAFAQGLRPSDRSCEPAGFECIFMTVEQDQLDGPPRGATTELAYARRRADVTRIGTFVIAVGGPGSGGLVRAEAVARGIPKRILDTYDIVIFDPRGVGSSDPVECPTAATDYRLLVDVDKAIGSATRFAKECAAESGMDAATLSTYGTDHTVEDVEAIRADLGVERIVLYGESYGTVVAQRYAALHGDRLEALILDGVVDLGQSSTAMWTEAAHGFEHVLDDTFVACRADVECRVDLPDPAASYDRIATLLEGQPQRVTFGDSDGRVRDHLIGAEDLGDVGSLAVYSPGGRSLFLRALAAATKGDWVPLGQMAYPGGRLVFTANESDLTYFSVGCTDFRHDPTEGIDSVETYVRSGERAGLFGQRLGTAFLSAAPCLAWPSRRPEALTVPYLTDTPYPVFVFTAEDDPITPPAAARRVAAALTDAYLFETAGGPHVTFANGNPCPDDLLAAFLVDGVRPSAREIRCPGEVLAPYMRFEPVRSLARLDAFEAADAIDLEIYLHPDYQGWDGTFTIAVGCRFGGAVALLQQEHQNEITFRACEVFEGVPVSGAGSYRDDGSVSLEVTFGENDLRYDVSPDGSSRISGTYNGAFISETR